MLEVEGPVEQVVKLLESAVDAADAPVIGVTEHGDLVFPPPSTDLPDPAHDAVDLAGKPLEP